MTCRHGICYGMKWLLRQEGARDHVDLLKSLKVKPTVTIIDFANMVASHGNLRFPGMFAPYEGRIAEPSIDNILAATNGTLEVQWPWFPNGDGNNVQPVVDQQLHPVTRCADHYALFDSFHQDNSKDPKDLLRRVSFVPQLEGVNTEVAEQLNSKRNKDNYFTSMMSPHNNLFVHRLSVNFLNNSLNQKIVDRHTKEVGYMLLIYQGTFCICISQQLFSIFSFSLEETFHWMTMVNCSSLWTQIIQARHHPSAYALKT